jgi:hypothetical protein
LPDFLAEIYSQILVASSATIVDNPPQNLFARAEGDSTGLCGFVRLICSRLAGEEVAMFNGKRQENRRQRRGLAIFRCEAEPLEKRVLLSSVMSGQGIEQSISSAGEQDTYTFSAMAGGTIEASVGTPTTMEMTMDLFSPTMTLLKSMTANTIGQTITLTSPSATPGIYSIVLTSANGHTGAYEFSEASVPGPQSKDTIDNAGGPVVSGQAVEGSIGGQLDVYSFSAVTGGTIEASVGTPTTMETEMDLFDPTGLMLATAKGTGTITVTAKSATTNTYYIVLESANGRTGAYEFSEASVPGTQSIDTIDNAGGLITSGQVVDGSIAGQLDAYSFLAQAGGTIVASEGTPTTMEMEMEMEMDLYDLTGLQLSTAKGTGTITVTAPSATTNTYYIIVKSANGITGAYEFSEASISGYSPNIIKTAYDINQVSFRGIPGDGKGQTIAIIDGGNNPTIATDLSAFDGAFGLPAPPSFLVEDEAGNIIDPATRSGPAKGTNGRNPISEEIDLDVEWAHAIAPSADLLLIEDGSGLSSDVATALGTAIMNRSVSVVSMSFVEVDLNHEPIVVPDSDFSVPDGFGPITFVAGSGDNGLYTDSSKTVLGPNYPASSSQVLAVGGTSLTVNGDGSWNSEKIWSDKSGTSGTGVSPTERLPSYQLDIGGNTTGRNVPDVAFDGDPATGVAIYDQWDVDNGGATDPWFESAGTSFAAPAWAALIAIVDQGRVAVGFQPLNSFETLSALYGAPNADFHKIGSSSYFNVGTGLGTPIANLLVASLGGDHLLQLRKRGLVPRPQTGIIRPIGVAELFPDPRPVSYLTVAQ